MKRKYYTTTEYVYALKVKDDGNLYEIKGKEFQLYTNKKAAEYDAQWLYDYGKRNNFKIKKPAVLEVRFKIVRTKNETKTKY